MAIVHRATLQPTKLELIAAWLPGQPWYTGGEPPVLEQVGAFRFDDPGGEVGVQVLLVRPRGSATTYQVPMTYRGEPLDGASAALMGEMSHSVLGRRFVYDACHDPVYVGELVRAVLTGGTGVAELVEVDGETITLPASMHVHGSGEPMSAVPLLEPLEVTSAGADSALTVIRAGSAEVVVPRVLGHGTTIDGTSTLIGEWGDGESQCLATVRVVDNQ